MFFRLFNIYIFLLTSFYIITASATADNYKCKKIYKTYLYRSEQALGLKLDVRFEEGFGNPLRQYKVYIYSIESSAPSKSLAELVFTHDPKENAIYVRNMDVHDEINERKALGYALMEETIFRLPNIQSVSASKMFERNLEVIEAKLSEGNSILESIIHSPAYKIWSEFGFTKIGPIKKNYGFTVTKP